MRDPAFLLPLAAGESSRNLVFTFQLSTAHLHTLCGQKKIVSISLTSLAPSDGRGSYVGCSRRGGGQRGQVTHVAVSFVREKALKRGSEILCPAGNHVLDTGHWSRAEKESKTKRIIAASVLLPLSHSSVARRYDSVFFWNRNRNGNRSGSLAPHLLTVPCQTAYFC